MKRQHQLMVYFLTSGIAALVNLGGRIYFSQWMGFNWAVTVAYFTGMLVNFCLSSLFVFSCYCRSNTASIFIKFVIVASIGMTITVTVAALLLHLLSCQNWLSLEISKLLAHITGIGSAFFASFIGHRYFTYRHTGIIAATKRLFS